jgi:hypothetical protein
MAYPDGGGVVVEVVKIRFGCGAAVEGVDDVVGSEGGVRAEDADLQVAKLVSDELALLEGDEEGVERGDVAVGFDEIRGKEFADGGEVSFGHGGPKMLFKVDDFDWLWRRRWRLGVGESGESHDKKKSSHGGIVDLRALIFTEFLLAEWKACPVADMLSWWVIVLLRFWCLRGGRHGRR